MGRDPGGHTLSLPQRASYLHSAWLLSNVWIPPLDSVVLGGDFRCSFHLSSEIVFYSLIAEQTLSEQSLFFPPLLNMFSFLSLNTLPCPPFALFLVPLSASHLELIKTSNVLESCVASCARF